MRVARAKETRNDLLTLVSSVELGLADESGTVAHVAPEEGVGWVCIASAHVA